MSKATENISNFPATGYRDSFANNIFLASEQVQFSGFAHCHLDQAAYNSWIVTLHLKANPKYSPRYTTWRSDVLNWYTPWEIIQSETRKVPSKNSLSDRKYTWYYA